MNIRTYREQDADTLAQIRRELGVKETAVSFRNRCRQLQKLGGRVWVACADGPPIACAFVVPFSGLPHLLQLGGFVTPARQRQGIATALLARLRQDLAGSRQQLSHGVADLDSPAARFLRQQGFELEHEEWQMVRETTGDETAVPPPHPQLALRTFPRHQTIRQFISLYNQIFALHPWYQPFTPQEVLDSLSYTNDIRFLMENEEPVGFIWVQTTNDEAEIEPIGIIPTVQGKGYGRWLLQTAVFHAAQQGIQRLHIGVWRQNETAVSLYQNLGFAHQQSRYFLAASLP